MVSLDESGSSVKSIALQVLRRTIALLLVIVVFVLIGRFADRTMIHLVHAGYAGVPVLLFLFVAVILAYVAFTAVLRFAWIIQRRLTLHGVSAGITLIWLAFLLAAS